MHHPACLLLPRLPSPPPHTHHPPAVKHYDKLRFPVAHWEPSMKCAHVLLLRRAPLNPYSGQVHCMLRDLMDNVSEAGTALHACGHLYCMLHRPPVLEGLVQRGSTAASFGGMHCTAG